MDKQSQQSDSSPDPLSSIWRTLLRTEPESTAQLIGEMTPSARQHMSTLLIDTSWLILTEDSEVRRTAEFIISAMQPHVSQSFWTLKNKEALWMIVQRLGTHPELSLN